MNGLTILLIALVCPLTMGVMMFMMMRGRGSHAESHRPETKPDDSAENRFV